MNKLNELYLKGRIILQEGLPGIKDEKGQTLTEYALILVLVGIVLVAALGTLSTGISGAYDKVVTALK